MAAEIPGASEGSVTGWTESNRLLRGSGRLFLPEGGEVYHPDKGEIPADHALGKGLCSIAPEVTITRARTYRTKCWIG